MMHGQQVTQSRRKRGLINVVGNIAHSLFGVLDDQFAEQYEKDINLIRKNQKHLALLWKNQTSIVEGEYNLIKRVEQAMDKQHKIFNQHIINLEKTNSNLAKQVQDVEINNEFSLSSIIANSILINLKNIQETLLDTMTNIHQGQFNLHLLTPEQLRDELNIISGQLSKDVSIPINNIQTELQNIYHLLKVKARMTSQYFIFEISIPLVSRDSFEIYRLISVPQQVGEQMISIKPIADHLAINIEKDSYLPMRENEIQSCTQYDDNTYLCPLQKPIYQMKSDDGLCQKSQETHQCKTETFTCDDSRVELSKMNQIKIKTNLIKIEIPPINNIINVSIPNIDLNPQESNDLQNDIDDVGRKIEQMKTNGINTILEDQISSHDLHQYVLLYILTSVAIISAGIIVWRRLKLRCSANLTLSPNSENRRSIDQTNRVHFIQENETEEQSRSHTTSEKVVNTNDSSARVLNKATSPILLRPAPRFTDQVKCSV
ncbi:baculovirus F protein domain-containing protein [Phthorimaea operculella]|nr:baculovirus F protein domain-containing protein [Phthorimaea operculella]